MHVTEFAERIVFGHTLEQKLAPPGKLTFGSIDPSCVPNVKAVVSPTRPVGLHMHSGPGLSQPPTDAELGNEKSRGRLLHFLANHELLATELMALVLLKFPDAPLPFRRGVLVTLQEEQEHTRLYLDRMRECGVEFGSYPLSGHFWRVVEPMRGPVDFVSRLSLTFEQANLDYSLHYAGLFEKLGDKKTAGILSQIYQDEIGHVRHGLEWFRKWKSPDLSDWEAYQSTLEFPMSPQRARGPKCQFNREGRRQAGLDEQFIDAVEVYRQSRGRPPVVRWFDPTIEERLAGIDSRAELMVQLHRDLDYLMLWCAKEDDIVLTTEAPTNTFRKYLLEVGAELPEFLEWQDIARLRDRKVASLEPWAWTPTVRRQVEPILPSVSSLPCWSPRHIDLFRKSWSAESLRDWLFNDQEQAWTPPVTCSGKRVSTIEEFEEAQESFRSHGYGQLLFKPDLATSGRGQRRYPTGEKPAGQELNWLSRSLEQQAGLLEPELDRIVDISFLFRMNGGLDFLGWTRQIVTNGRRYAGTLLRRPFAECTAEIKRFLLANECEVLHSVKEWLREHLESELRDRQFTGLCGVDAFVFRSAEGLRLKPIVEFNARCTMGHIALRLEEHVAPVSRGEFRILRFEEFCAIRTRLSEHPVEFASDGSWKAGVVTLSEPTESSKLVPLVFVGDARQLLADSL